MKKTVYIFYVTCFFLISCQEKKHVVKKDDFPGKINKLVLSENKVDQEFYFKHPYLNGSTIEYIIVYLGDIKTSDGKQLKFLKKVVLTGPYEDSKRGGCTVDIYDDSNEKIGHYYVGGIGDGPQKIENDNLVFSYNNDRCDQTTKISFKDSIPGQIFISCTKGGGDVFTFSRD